MIDIELLEKNLNKNGFVAKIVASHDDLYNEVKKILPDKAEIGAGGSVTLDEVGILKALNNDGYIINSNKYSDLPVSEVYKKARNSDFYFTGTNAVTLDGKLVNIDGKGNRISSMIFGVPNVVVVLGRNKCVPNLDEAMKRIKEVACPLNARRLGRKTPCAITGKCGDCNSADRMCKVTAILERPCSETNVFVFILNEDLGY